MENHSGSAPGAVKYSCQIVSLTSATFGQLLELAGSLPDAIVLRAEVFTSSSYRDAKAASLETPVSVCQCVSVGVSSLFYSDLPTPSKVSIRSRNIK